MRYLIVFIVSLFFAVGLPDSLYAQQTDSSVSDGSSWFSEFGIGFGAAAVFQETATSSRLGEFSVGWALGPDLLLGIWRNGFHKVYLGAGYLFYGPKRVAGTEQIKVTTSYHRFDLAAGYDFRYKLLVAGVHIGSAMILVKTHHVFREINHQVEDDLEVVFSDGAIIDEHEALGIDFGFLGGTSIGIDIGRLFSKHSRHKVEFELRATGEYIRRGQRDAFCAGGMIVFWPLSLLR
ncbi:MAG: hypothetical protein GY847_00370 [Proteobacteria bacterium]|nr:hypothetical protein [Pseudomonadota bacterium]